MYIYIYIILLLKRDLTTKVYILFIVEFKS